LPRRCGSDTLSEDVELLPSSFAAQSPRLSSDRAMVESSTVTPVDSQPRMAPREDVVSDRPLVPTNGNGRNESKSEPSPESSSESPAPSLPAAKTYFGLTRADHLVLAILSAVALSLMIWHWARLSGWGMRPVEVEHLEPESLDYRININTATWVEWVQLDGIGETLAERIVADREANGPFRNIDDLRRVKGIGPKTLARIRRYLTVGRPDGVKSR
jgi:competence protein ComEA